MANNFGHRVAPDNSYYAFTRGTEDFMRFGGANGDNSGQLAGFRNVLINGKLSINQRGVTIAAAAIGSYGPDRWKKVDASNMTQIVEAGNYVPSAVYTLSGDNVATGQITAPASGHWTLPNIPITAANVQLEKGYIPSDRENRLGLEEFLCLRYYESSDPTNTFGRSDAVSVLSAHATLGMSCEFKVIKRVAPSIILIAAVTGTPGCIRNISASTNVPASVPLIGVARFMANAGSLTIGSTYEWGWTANAEL